MPLWPQGDSPDDSGDLSWTYAETPDPALLAKAAKAGKRAGRSNPPQVGDTPEYLETLRAAFVAANHREAEATETRWDVTYWHFDEARVHHDSRAMSKHLQDLQGHIDRYEARRRHQVSIYLSIEKAFLDTARPRWQKKRQSWTETPFEIPDLLVSRKKELEKMQSHSEERSTSEGES